MKKRGFVKRIAAITAFSILLTEIPFFPASEVNAAEEETMIGGKSSYLSEELYDKYGLTYDIGGGSVLGDETTEGSGNGTTEAIIENDPTEVKKYTITADPADGESYSDYGPVTAWKNRTTIKAPANTYCLHVGTGASAGDTVLYYAIDYVDSKKVKRTQFIFPEVDGIKKSNALLEYGANGKNLNETYGRAALGKMNYSEAAVGEDALASWSVQDYVFQTESDIADVKMIRIYLGQGSWTVQGMELYKVDEYKGYEEYGIVSGKSFLDFKGEKVADIAKTNSGTLTYSTSGADYVITIGETNQDDDYATVQNYDTGEVPKGYAVDNSVYSFRMDLVDQINAGLESFINPSAENVDSFKSKIVEDIVLEFQYKDKSGWTRKVALPVLLSSYISLLEKEKDGVVIGFAQRGDTLAFPGLFPDMDYITGSVTVNVGKTARDKLLENGINITNSNSNVQDTLNSLTSDSIQVAGLSFYKGGSMPYIQDGVDSNGKNVKGATVNYAFQNGPFTYFTTTDERGHEIKQGGKENFKLSQYKDGAPLVASTSVKNKFLVTVSTSNVSRTGTKDDVTVRFRYLTRAGQENKTNLYNVKTASVDFMGVWPATNGADFISSIALTEGSSVSFLVDAINLKQFLSADINLLGGDEWQLNNLTIDYVEKFEKRRAYLVDREANGVKTHYWIDRSMVSAQLFNMNGSAITVIDKNGNIVDKNGKKLQDGKVPLLDENGNPVTQNGEPVYIDADDVVIGRAVGDSQFFSGKMGYTFNFTDGDIEKVEKISYKDVLHKMTYKQTSIDWGFFEKEKTYDVSVKVAADPDYDNGDGDSGSKNYFYFQLLFNNGNSAYVLANQQLTSDGFRSGKTETFSIATNRNYGDLLGIRIIPEDLSEDTDVFDKLNIEKITITEATNGGTFMNYIIDNVGWIEIDYRDEMEAVVPGGQKARTATEIARYFKVTDKQKSVRLLCEMVTLPWDNDYLPFQGSVIAEVTYVNSATNKIETTSFDVVQYIAAYMNKTAISVETSTDPNSQVVKAAGLNTISDPEWMFRPNHTDRFIMPAIPDLGAIKSIQFTAQTRNGYPAIWNIGQISISQIIEDSGSLQLTANEEYYRDIETQELCQSTNTKVISTTLPIGKAQRTPKINFTEHQIVWVSDEWATPVSRIPESINDTVNIYVYPTANSKNIEGVRVNPTFKYGVPFSKYKQISPEYGMFTANSGTNDAVFYVKGLSTKDFTSAGELELQCTNGSMLFDYAVVQHIRDEVVIDTYEYYFFGASATMGANTDPSGSRQYTKNTREELILQFGKDTELQELIPEKYDIAVSLQYTSLLDPTGTEYSTPFVYLTDVGYSSIYEGLWANVPFEEDYVDTVTGYTIAAYGNLKGNIIGSAIYTYDVTNSTSSAVTFEEISLETKLKSYVPIYDDYKDNFVLRDSLTKRRAKNKEYYGPDSFTPVYITFDTVEGPKKSKAGDNPKIKAVVHYTDYKDTEVSITYDDLTQYIVGDERQFLSGKSQTVKLLLPNMGSNYNLISADILPYYDELKTDKEIKDVVEDAANEKDAAAGGQAEAAATGQSQDAKVEDPDNPSAEAILEDMINNGNVSWTISHAVAHIADDNGTIPLENKTTQTFSGLQQGGTLKFSNSTISTSIAKNGEGDKTIGKDPVSFLAKKDDIFTGKAVVLNSTEGFVVHAYRKVGDAREEVTEENVVVDNATNKFWFVVPESKDPYSDTVYILEVSPKDSPDVVDTVLITVEKTKNAADAVSEGNSNDQSTDNSGGGSGTGTSDNGGNSDNSGSSDNSGNTGNSGSSEGSDNSGSGSGSTDSTEDSGNTDSNTESGSNGDKPYVPPAESN